jgi:mannose-1-phosphate guanylyltransferase
VVVSLGATSGPEIGYHVDPMTASTSSSPRILVLAGGAGTRFWPASRSVRPKQLLPLTGRGPLLAETVRRVLPLAGGDKGWDNVLVATGAHLVAPTLAGVPELAAKNLLVEPVPRNTAPCIGWAAAVVARTDPDAVIVVLPSDHHIVDEARFVEVLAAAIRSAEEGVVTTIGIQPTHPETGYGYIEIADDAALSGRSEAPRAARVKRFVEKPDRARAEVFLASGRFLWNAGMFIFRAKDMVAAVRAHLPALADGLDALDRAAAEGREEEALRELFPKMPSTSIDFGVMEHLEKIAVIPGDFGWNDLGSFQSAWELAQKDADGNAAPEGAVVVGSRGSLVLDLRTKASEKRVIALVGVEDLVVVETDDGLLVTTRDRCQDVKDVVAALKSRGDADLT